MVGLRVLQIGSLLDPRAIDPLAKLKMIVFSDGDNSKEIPPYFEAMLDGFRKREDGVHATNGSDFQVDFFFHGFGLTLDYVVLVYANGLVHKLFPAELTKKNLRPLFSMLGSYVGKSHLEIGMEVQLRSNKRYDKCEAVVKGVDLSPENVDKLFNKLDNERKNKV
jgi:hypothetical protein